MTIQIQLQQIKAQIPVIDGLACQEIRLKLNNTLQALQIAEVGRCIAIAEFSLLYRTLNIGERISIAIDRQHNQIELQLSCQLPSQIATVVCNEFKHFRPRLIDYESGDQINRDELTVQLISSYQPQQIPNFSLAEEILTTATSSELRLAASKTKQNLESTQAKLSTVQKDLQIAADIQLHMLLSKSQLRAISPDLDCHAYMVPCRDIGGDLFDVIALGNERFAFVIGDVSGKGVPAALMMATCITLIRAYCETQLSPSKILEKVNTRLLEGNEDECMFTTLFLGIFDGNTNHMSYCNAGHTPCLIQHEAGGLHLLSEIHGPALGVIDGHSYEEDRIDFLLGDRLILYTDGVSEGFNENGELYGFERIESYCTESLTTMPSRRYLSGLMLDINCFCGTEQAHDDVTLLAVKRRSAQANQINKENEIWLTAVAKQTQLASLKQAAEQFCNKTLANNDVVAKLLLVLDELLINIINHATSPDSTNNVQIELLLRNENDKLYIKISDTGKPFNPMEKDDPLTDLSLDDREVGGLGLFFVKALAESLAYEYQAPWNCLTFIIRYD